MKVLFLTNKIPYLAKDGGSLASLNFIRTYQKANDEVFLLSFNTSKHFVDINKVSDKSKNKLLGLETVNLKNNKVNLFDFLSAFFSKKSINIERFNKKEFLYKLKQIIKKYKFDIVQVEVLHISVYTDEVRKLTKAKIIYRAHNIEHFIWKRLAKETNNIVKKLLYNFLARRMKQFELSQIQKFDKILTISSVDEKYLQQYTETVIKTVPFVYKYDKNKFVKKDLIPNSLYFLASFDWRPNKEGLDWFLTKVFPLIIEKNKEVKLFVAGRNMPDKMKKQNIKNVVFVGEVENQIEFIADKKIMINPILSGSGVRIKLIEALSLGKIAISTTIGAEGIQIENEKSIIIADTEKEFAEAILSNG